MNNSLYRGLVTAFMFLTRLPMPQLDNYQAEDAGKALALFPLVGLVIGLFLCVLSLLPLPALALSALLVTFWVFITGGLHIDGLADSADGWLGGLNDKARSLEIMKDPVCGSAAVMSVGCLLIVKFAAIASLVEQQHVVALLLAPMIGRCVPPLLFLTTDYVSKNGLAAAFIEHADKKTLNIVLLICGLLTLLFSGFIQTLILLFVLSSVLYGLRELMMSRLGGNTGDTTGASVEIIEACTLLVFCL